MPVVPWPAPNDWRDQRISRHRNGPEPAIWNKYMRSRATTQALFPWKRFLFEKPICNEISRGDTCDQDHTE